MLKKTESKQKPITIRDIKIKTGVVKRTGKELQMYADEIIKQKQRITKLEENNADIHDIRKQNEVLEESVAMLPDTKKRLIMAHRELADLLNRFEADGTEEEIEVANSVLTDVEPLLV
ncbi:tubulin binding cofactor A-domain-containing protein [Globomyces pollinis-pini]|nr:tubulin binding cofactor A-domain-containing protein [Globomyces pollinis-pini]